MMIIKPRDTLKCRIVQVTAVQGGPSSAVVTAFAAMALVSAIQITTACSASLQQTAMIKNSGTKTTPGTLIGNDAADSLLWHLFSMYTMGRNTIRNSALLIPGSKTAAVVIVQTRQYSVTPMSKRCQ
jgi:hypothetical protein